MPAKLKASSQVLVVGAGPVGMFTALRLAESGIGVQLIDKESGVAGHSYACALHPRTLQLLDEVGLARAAIKLGQQIETVAFYERALPRAELKLSLLPVKFPFVLVLQQNILEELLAQKLKERDIAIHWNHRLADLTMKEGAATATIEELAMEGKGYAVPDFQMAVKKTVPFQAGFIVGADGQGSIVRQRLDLKFEWVGKPQLFVVYEFETGDKLEPEMKIVFDKDTAGVLWPFTQKNGRWGFQWPDAGAPADFPPKVRSRFNLMDLPGSDDNRHHLQKLLAARAPWFKDNIKEVGWAADIQFEHQLAQRFGRDQAWLVGDSAHQTGPIGMQSMNMGFREGADLAARLARILHDKAPADLLETYSREHHLEWEQLLGWKGAPRANDATDEWIRQHAARILPCIPASGGELTLLLHQLGLEFEPAPLPNIGAEAALSV